MLALKETDPSRGGTGQAFSGSLLPLLSLGHQPSVLALSYELEATLGKQDAALNIELPIYLRTSKQKKVIKEPSYIAYMPVLCHIIKYIL